MSVTITTFNNVVIQQSIIKGVPQQCVGDWVFISADEVLTCTPFQQTVQTGFATSITNDNPYSNSFNNDFIGVKVGDLTGNAFMKQGLPLDDVAPEAAKVTLTPNPFGDVATLRLDLPEDETAQIHAFDLTGKLLHEQVASLSNGSTTVEIDATTWPSGTLIYQVISASGNRSGRMIHMK